MIRSLQNTEVSTLIPVYNGSEYIRGAVDSALGQKDVAQEVIVIDDGSTDDTPQILESYGDSIRVITQKNSGHVRARNNGAAIANGHWLAFLDADDEWQPMKLSCQLERVTDAVGMVYTNRENFGSIERISATAADTHTLHSGDLFGPLLFGNFVTVASVIMRKEWFNRLHGFDESPFGCEDWDLWLRFSAAGGLASVCHEPLTRYRLHAASMSNNHVRMCQGRLKVIERALATERGRRLSYRERLKIQASVWKCSAWYAMPWRRTTAIRWYLHSAFHWPWDADLYKQLFKCCVGHS